MTPALLLRVRPGLYELQDDWTYEGAKGDEWTLLAGFFTDLASVPRPCRWLIDTDGDHADAALVHDFLCRDPDTTRRDADGIFRRVLLELRVPRPRAWVMWAAVRLGSRLSGATWTERSQVLGIALLVVPYLCIPVGAVVLFGAGWRLLEWAVGPPDDLPMPYPD